MNFFLGVPDTIDIFAFRWRMIRQRRTKVGVFILLAFLVLVIINLSTLSYSIRLVAQDTNSSAFPEQLHSLALSYLQVVLQGHGVFAATYVLSALFGSLFLIPLLGYSAGSIIPEGDIVSIRKNDYHRLSDSFMLQLFSSFSLIQIVVILMLNSLLGFESVNAGVSILLGWCLWFIVAAANTLVTWVLEYVYRRFGSKGVYAVPVIALVGGGLLYTIFPEAATHLFGISDVYVELVKHTASYPIWGIALVAVGFLGIMFLFFVAVSIVGSHALNLSERPRRRRARVAALFGRRRKTFSLYLFFINNLLRMSNTRKPLIFTPTFALGSLIAFAGSQQVLETLVFVVPLIVTMTWGTNTFGILGGGTTWLLSLPSARRVMLPRILAVQFTLIGVLQGIMIALLIFVYHTDWPTVLNFAGASIISSLLMSIWGLRKSVYHPERYRAHIRGESVLPLSKALAYLAQYVLGAGILGLAVFLLGNLYVTALVLGVTLVWQGIRYAVLNRHWLERSDIIENIVKSVGI